MSEYRADIYQEMREKIRAWLEDKGKGFPYAEYLLALPDLLHLLCRLCLDKDVPAEKKAFLAVVIAYIISPVDLLSEIVVGPPGYLDDVALAAYALNAIINQVDPEIVQRHWAGSGDVLALIRQILEVAHEMLGGKMWQRIKRIIDGLR